MNRKIIGILIVLLFIGADFVPSILGRDIDNKRYILKECQNNDSTTNHIEAFYLYIGKIRNLIFIEDENRAYYKWYAAQLFVFWIYQSNILPYEVGLKYIIMMLFTSLLVLWMGFMEKLIQILF